MPIGVRSRQKALEEELVLRPRQRAQDGSALTRGAAGAEKGGVVGPETSLGDAAITAKQDGHLVPG